jgi:hypothetical protein
MNVSVDVVSTYGTDIELLSRARLLVFTPARHGTAPIRHHGPEGRHDLSQSCNRKIVTHP